jgi:cell wall-associated NlpC family hydrolase
MRTSGLVFLLTLLACVPAAAAGAEDELDRFINARGLVEPAARPPAAPADFAPSTPPAAAPVTVPAPAADSRADRMSELVVAAMGAIGVPYRRGGNTYDSGFDCSGFVRAVYEQTLGLTLPRQAAQQAAATQVIDRSDLQPGDLVFFNTLRRDFSHVGIYVGDFKFIHSPKPGAAVRIEDIRVGYWTRRFDGARRVVGGVPARQSQPTSTAANLSYPSY